jgi:hypothetical protein
MAAERAIPAQPFPRGKGRTLRPRARVERVRAHTRLESGGQTPSTRLLQTRPSNHGGARVPLKKAAEARAAEYNALCPSVAETHAVRPSRGAAMGGLPMPKHSFTLCASAVLTYEHMLHTEYPK